MTFDALPAIVIDNGSGYTKMGYAENADPQLVIPTAIATVSMVSPFSGPSVPFSKRSIVHEFAIGEDAVRGYSAADVHWPIRHGQVADWDEMETFWLNSLGARYLRCNPEQHHVLLTEPPLNSPENRECTAEIWYQDGLVDGWLCVGLRRLACRVCTLACRQSWLLPPRGLRREPLQRQTHSPVWSLTRATVSRTLSPWYFIGSYIQIDGYAVSSAVKHIPLAGRDLTGFIQQLLRDRNEPVPPEDSFAVAKKIKETLCYTAPDLASEFLRFDAEPAKCIARMALDKAGSGEIGREIEVGYERFLAPETFFNPELISSDYSTPLPDLVDSVIQACPIDARRALYSVPIPSHHYHHHL